MFENTCRNGISPRDAIWRGAQRRSSLDSFKSVYSIFVSRVDVYTEKKVPELSKDAQGLVGIVNVKRLWKLLEAQDKSHQDPRPRLPQEQ